MTGERSTQGGWRPPWLTTGRLVGIAAAALLLIITAANVHLVYVAVQSQPDCVAATTDKVAARHRAAKVSC